ncbi:MAG: FtsX-like permease family protein [Anaerolineae bacterium]|nr:FtsX-like permease family protein [Anaerolineae bacterium]
MVGTTAEYAAVRNLEVASGRFLTSQDVEEQRCVVILGATLTSDLFGFTDPLSQSVRINNEPFEVMGVLKERGGFGFESVDTQAFVPISVAQSRLFNAPRHRGEYIVTSINVQVADESQMDTAQQQIEATLRLRHNLKATAENDFSIFNQASLLEVASEVSQTLTVFLGAIGAISLLVGGIGIMNIMLVSVTERTREIGLRKAVGARDGDILLQFLTEALVLCALGGLMGISFSYLVAAVFSRFSDISFRVKIEPDSLVLALGVSLASGLVFGLYPAWRATQLDPIEALRYE